MSDAESVTTLIAWLKEEFRGIDILVVVDLKLTLNGSGAAFENKHVKDQLGDVEHLTESVIDEVAAKYLADVKERGRMGTQLRTIQRIQAFVGGLRPIPGVYWLQQILPCLNAICPGGIDVDTVTPFLRLWELVDWVKCEPELRSLKERTISITWLTLLLQRRDNCSNGKLFLGKEVHSDDLYSPQQTSNLAAILSSKKENGMSEWECYRPGAFGLTDSVTVLTMTPPRH